MKIPRMIRRLWGADLSDPRVWRGARADVRAVWWRTLAPLSRWAPVGDDGLTKWECTALAAEYGATGARTPTLAEFRRGRATLDRIIAAQAEGWDEGFEQGWLDATDDDGPREYPAMLPNPYRR